MEATKLFQARATFSDNLASESCFAYNADKRPADLTDKVQRRA
jgi:hypothetical protein